MDNKKHMELRGFLNEYQFATGRDLSGKLAHSSLPDPSSFPTNHVTMTKQMVVRFRNDYKLLVEFAALMCGVLPENLVPFDLFAPFLKPAPDDDL